MEHLVGKGTVFVFSTLAEACKNGSRGEGEPTNLISHCTFSKINRQCVRVPEPGDNLFTWIRNLSTKQNTGRVRNLLGTKRGTAVVRKYGFEHSLLNNQCTTVVSTCGLEQSLLNNRCLSRERSVKCRSRSSIGEREVDDESMVCSIIEHVCVEERLVGKIFGVGDEGSNWWDAKCLFHPIVVRDPLSQIAEWRMYYYGRDRDEWHSGVSPALLSTGRIGIAVSADGVKWQRYRGPLGKGAILDPNGISPLAFDAVHIGCSDVFFHKGEWWMYYFGGSTEKIEFGSSGENSAQGLRMRTGLAKSADGVVFQNGNRVLDVGGKGDWDELCIAWARVIPPEEDEGEERYYDDDGDEDTEKWLMTYASVAQPSTNPLQFSVGIAISTDGTTWAKLGKRLEKGNPGAWDDGGVGRRHVLLIDGLYVMFYEGVNQHGTHAIGLAFSDDGFRWMKHMKSGGPIFTPRIGQDVWDNGGVAAPHLVQLPDGSFRMYYVGSDATKTESAIGLAVSDGCNFRSWKRYLE